MIQAFKELKLNQLFIITGIYSMSLHIQLVEDYLMQLF
jgi:hypothetical protein